MKKLHYLLVFFGSMILLFSVRLSAQTLNSNMHEKFRPQIHFSPRQGWMNDPNGMVYLNGTYHLFYQHYPDSSVWGPMHWGHATSNDLVHWKEQPIGLYPDSLGYIFSGSIVADELNTSGFSKNGATPLVALFTHHNIAAEKRGERFNQSQSLAYSLDSGRTWLKYAHNPVLPNPGISDFRDPKLLWDKRTKTWIMTLAVKDHISFYSSPDLKNWKHETDFGNNIGAHGGVWECPDLFPVKYDGREYWVLIVSINPGAPNGGSGTQYFIGDFNGHVFTPLYTTNEWLDYGKDHYAAVTFAHTDDKPVLIGWMSNWQYAGKVPTTVWRGAATLPRQLTIAEINHHLYVKAMPVAQVHSLEDHAATQFVLQKDTVLYNFKAPVKIVFKSNSIKNFSIVFSNKSGNKVMVGFDTTSGSYFINRIYSGNIGFDKNFPGIHWAKRISHETNNDLTIYMDEASVELFADDGLIAMTDILFPDEPLNTFQIIAAPGSNNLVTVNPLKAIWE